MFYIFVSNSFTFIIKHTVIMENYYYLYYGVGVFAILFAIYIVIIRKKAKNAGYGGMLEVDNSSFTIQQKQALAHGAIMSRFRMEEVFSMSFNLKRRGKYEQGLAAQWGVTDHDSAVQSIIDLINLEKTKELDPILHSANPAQLEELYKTIAKSLVIPVENVKRVKSTYAWNTVRAVALARWSFWIGYISYEEAWQYILQASKVAQEYGTDWEEYTCSFLIGRELHGFGITGIIYDAYQLLHNKGKAAGVYNNTPFK